MAAAAAGRCQHCANARNVDLDQTQSFVAFVTLHNLEVVLNPLHRADAMRALGIEGLQHYLDFRRLIGIRQEDPLAREILHDLRRQAGQLPPHRVIDLPLLPERFNRNRRNQGM